jgi:predicted acetyltransferase
VLDEKIIMKLIELTNDLKEAFLDFANDYERFGENRYLTAKNNFDEFVEKIRKGKEKENLPPKLVPGIQYFLLDDKIIIGSIRFRFYLNDKLEEEGGHIGYDVRPSERRCGYGTLMLKLILEKVEEKGLQEILITCDSDNIGSRKIIEKNGGIFINEVFIDSSEKYISRFKIILTSSKISSTDG